MFDTMTISTGPMQKGCSFQHFSVQYEYAILHGNVLSVKGGYFKKS